MQMITRTHMCWSVHLRSAHFLTLFYSLTVVFFSLHSEVRKAAKAKEVNCPQATYSWMFHHSAKAQERQEKGDIPTTHSHLCLSALLTEATWLLNTEPLTKRTIRTHRDNARWCSSWCSRHTAEISTFNHNNNHSAVFIIRQIDR